MEMKRLARSHHFVALSGLLLCFSACGISDDPRDLGVETASEGVDDSAVRNELADPFDSERAAQIARIKRALIPPDAVPLQAASCGSSGPTNNVERVIDAAVGGAANQRSGSSTSCGIAGVLQPSDDADYYCFTIDGNFTWTYLRNVRTNVRGWTRDDLLRAPPGAPIGGARDWCGF